ncbi:MAG TPA: hypothetical protein VGV40_03980 [Solirubrobacteraceae bacterium]|nr:hypothetical protein [Solirubrobacteraceae bacterium]
MAGGELGVGALGPAQGDLHRAEQVLLQLVGVVLVELLVGVAQGRERNTELVDRLGDGVEQLLPGVRADVGHG